MATKNTTRRVGYAILGALIAVGSIVLFSLVIVAASLAAKAWGLTATDVLGIFSLVMLAAGGGVLGWMHAKGKEA